MSRNRRPVRSTVSATLGNDHVARTGSSSDAKGSANGLDATASVSGANASCDVSSAAILNEDRRGTYIKPCGTERPALAR